jgi:hypothetical protein
MELAAVAQHTVQNDGQLTGHSDRRLLDPDLLTKRVPQAFSVDQRTTLLRMIPAASNG